MPKIKAINPVTKVAWDVDEGEFNAGVYKGWTRADAATSAPITQPSALANLSIGAANGTITNQSQVQTVPTSADIAPPNVANANTVVNQAKATAVTAASQATQYGNGRLANENYVNAAFKELHGRDARIEELTRFKGKGLQDVYNAIRAGAPVPKQTATGNTGNTNNNAATNNEAAAANEQPKSISEQLDEMMTSSFDRAAANDQYDVEEKSDVVNTLKGELDAFKNEMDLNSVLDTAATAEMKNKYYEGKESLDNRVMSMGYYNNNLSKLASDTNIALDKKSIAAAVAEATNVYKYNSKLIEYSVAMGDLQNAQNMVQQMAQDFKDFNTQKLQILQFQNTIDQQEAAIYQREIDREYEMATSGYTYVQSPSALQELAKTKGTQWVKDNTINISGRIYIKPDTDKAVIQAMQSKYVDAGITSSDTLATATVKLRNSAIYKNETTSAGDSGTWSIQTDESGSQYKFNNKTGETASVGQKGSVGGQCGEYINDYYGTSVGDSWESKQAIANTDLKTFQSSPQVNDVVVFKTKMPYGHIAAVTAVNGDQITITESNWNGDEKVGTRTISVNDKSITGIYRGATLKQTTPAVNLVKKDGVPIVQKVNGKDYNVTTNGDFVAPKTPAADTTEAKNISAVKAEAALDLKSSKGLKSAVGTYLGRTAIKPASIAAQQDFIAGVEQLVSGMTLQSLIDAKAQGATFGALSEGELRILASSASKIGSWRVTKDGKVTGYKTGEQSMKDELQKMYDLFQKDAGSTPEKPANSTPIDIGGYTVGTIVSDGGKKYKVINANGDLEEVK